MAAFREDAMRAVMAYFEAEPVDAEEAKWFEDYISRQPQAHQVALRGRAEFTRNRGDKPVTKDDDVVTHIQAKMREAGLPYGRGPVNKARFDSAYNLLGAYEARGVLDK